MRRVTVGDIAEVVSGGTPARNRPEFWGGRIPWVKTGAIDFCLITEADEWITEQGLENSAARIIPAGTILMAMYGQGKTRGQVAILGIDAAINQACAALLLQEGCDRDFVYQQLAFRYASIRKMSNSGGQDNLNADLVRSIAFPLPDDQEQRKIGALLKAWDGAVSTVRRLIDAKRARKRGLMQQLLTGRKRFKVFKGERWQTVRLRDVATESNLRNNGKLDRSALMAVTKADGIVPMREKVQGEDVARCKIVKLGWLAYNPMRLNIGSIARWTGDREVMVSGDYVVFHCDEDRIGHRWLDQFRRTHRWTSFVQGAGNGSVRVRIWFSDLGHLKFELPPLAEQRRVAAVLETCDREIELLQKQLDALKEQKRGLMQKLLTGQIRVCPADQSERQVTQGTTAEGNGEKLWTTNLT